MTVALAGEQMAAKIEENLPGSVVASNRDSLEIRSESLLPVATFLKTAAGFEFDYLASITGVDYSDSFELIYHLTSLEHNHSLVVKTRCYDRDEPSVASVVSLWQGADHQEREIYDLLGIRFEGHPRLKRIFLWEGFQGHPLRRDYL